MPSYFCSGEIIILVERRSLFFIVRTKPFIPDAQTLLTVVQITVLGIPAPNAACLAGACPKFALSTFPKKISCTSDGSMFAL